MTHAKDQAAMVPVLRRVDSLCVRTVQSVLPDLIVNNVSIVSHCQQMYLGLNKLS